MTSIKFEIILEGEYWFVAHLGVKPKPNKSGIITWKCFFNDGYILLNSKKLLSNPCKRIKGCPSPAMTMGNFE